MSVPQVGRHPSLASLMPERGLVRTEPGPEDREPITLRAAGARVVTPAADQYWGDRYGVVEDPFGFQWSFSHPLVKR